MEGPPTRLQVEGQHARLRERLAVLAAGSVVGDVTRVFLEVATVAVAKGLWSLEFAFDEDDSRVARLEARFGNGLLAERTGAELRGYAALIVLPKMLPKNTFDGSRASEHLQGMPSDPMNLVARFVRSLNELGAYRFIEPLAYDAIETEQL